MVSAKSSVLSNLGIICLDFGRRRVIVCCGLGRCLEHDFKFGCTMSTIKKWIINIIILIVAAVIMLAVAEVGMRWWDGYRLSTIELDQGVNQAPLDK